MSEDTPIFRRLADELLIDLPTPPVRPDGRAPALAHAAPGFDPGAALAPRIDGWCEDRPLHELTDEDGVD